MTKKMEKILKHYFGYDTFRPLQREIVEWLMQGKDALVLMPTGAGKSICYQVPALMMRGMTVVVSPLISLMKDQVQSLVSCGIVARALNTGVSEAENQETRRECLEGKVKILYVSPERLLSDLDFFRSAVPEVSLFAIDEAHCISSWGHDFRPEYAQLDVLRAQFPGVPIVALTATADKVTRLDILKQLNLPDARMFISSFDRSNLSLEVRRGLDARQKRMAIMQFLLRHPDDCGIIYCLSRAAVDDLAAYLCDHKVSAAAYHAGLSAEERSATQDAFLCDRVQVVCATVAFGMGINKSNVRFVIHYNMPKSIENFYQEIGRAGRDGLPSETLLFYNAGDIVQLSHFAENSGQREINMERLRRMREYAEADVCRRRILLNYFGEPSTRDCGHCDVCHHPPQRFDGTVLVQKALSAIVRCEENIGMRTVVDVLCGLFSSEVKARHLFEVKTFGAGREVPLRDWNDYLLQMLQMGMVEILYDRHNHLHVTEAGWRVLRGEEKVMLSVVHHEEKTKARDRKGKKAKAAPLLGLSVAPMSGQEDVALFEHLRQLRSRLAQEQQLPPYIIFSDKVLHLLATSRPSTLEEFGNVSGIGEYKCQKYGTLFLKEIASHVKG